MDRWTKSNLQSKAWADSHPQKPIPKWVTTPLKAGGKVVHPTTEWEMHDLNIGDYLRQRRSWPAWKAAHARD